MQNILRMTYNEVNNIEREKESDYRLVLNPINFNESKFCLILKEAKKLYIHVDCVFFAKFISFTTSQNPTLFHTFVGSRISYFPTLFK